MIRPDVIPDAFAADPRSMEALDYLLAHPELAHDQLLAAVTQLGGEYYQSAAAILIAADQLRRRGIL
jgi:hypothetical protein